MGAACIGATAARSTMGRISSAMTGSAAGAAPSSGSIPMETYCPAVVAVPTRASRDGRGCGRGAMNPARSVVVMAVATERGRGRGSGAVSGLTSAGRARAVTV